MQIEFRDFNNAGSVISSKFAKEWADLRLVLDGMPLHLKASDQAKKKGHPIFDPVGTNAYIKAILAVQGWSVNIPIPNELKVFGTDVDYASGGFIAEAQFSNYPFLLNNLIRSELFLQSGPAVFGQPVEAIVIITKGRMPSSNSTLYYEQAVGQLAILERTKLFSAPIRIVGLMPEVGPRIPVRMTKYKGSRASRTVDTEADIVCEVTAGKTARNQCRFQLLDS